MTSVWAVETGEYEDYQVVALYTNEDAAKRHCDQMNTYEKSVLGGDKYTYSEWVAADECPRIYPVYIASDLNGGVARYIHSSDDHRGVDVTVDPRGLGVVVTGSDPDKVNRAYQEATS